MSDTTSQRSTTTKTKTAPRIDRDAARRKEQEWARLASSRTDSEFMVVEDVKSPEVPDLSDWSSSGHPEVNVQATRLEMRLGHLASQLAVFFLRFHWVPFFTALGMFWARRAFWFTGGEIPVGDPSQVRDHNYLTGRHRR